MVAVFDEVGMRALAIRVAEFAHALGDDRASERSTVMPRQIGQKLRSMLATKPIRPASSEA